MQSGNTWGQLQALPWTLPCQSLCAFTLPLDLDVFYSKLVMLASPKLLERALTLLR